VRRPLAGCRSLERPPPLGQIPLEYSDKNEFTHLYTAHIKPDGTYEVLPTRRSTFPV
jgi:hypothetical protein